MHRRIADLLKNASPGDAAEIRGWVRTRRDSKGGFSFVEVNDGSCFASLQAVVPAEVPGYEETIKDVTTGSSVVITGKLVESPGKGQRLELQANSLRLLGTADAEAYPLQKKRHSFEFLRDIAHLRTAHQHVRSCVPRAEPRFVRDSRVLPAARLPLRPLADHHDK